MYNFELAAPFKGMRILVVVNDFFDAADLDLAIEDAGGEVVALIGNIRDAVALLSREPVDAAIIDPHLADGPAGPVIADLVGRGVHFVILTGDRSGGVERNAGAVLEALSGALRPQRHHAQLAA